VCVCLAMGITTTPNNRGGKKFDESRAEAISWLYSIVIVVESTYGPVPIGLCAVAI
jgi:hypothetical protein